MSEIYARRSCETDLHRLHEDVYTFVHKSVNISLPVCIFGLFTVTFHLSNHLVANILGFGGSPFEHFSASMKLAYLDMSKRSVTRMDWMVSNRSQQRFAGP